MLGNWKGAVERNIFNVPGWRTDRKIVVFESDDWGSMRMPSKEAYSRLTKKGIRVDKSIYDTFDTLEQREDLESLLNTLSSHEDFKGNQPIFTMNMVMGNPDYEQIKKDDYAIYHHEDLFTSYKKYHQEDITDLWHSGIEAKLLQPQFHAREHLNVSVWMKALQQKHQETIIAFKHNFYGLKTNVPLSEQRNYLAAYWPENEHDFKEKIKILEDGLDMFQTKFGFKSKSFVACNFIYPKEMEHYLSEFGVKYIQTQRGHISPDIKTGKKQISRHFLGKENDYNQHYLIRNCFFEPTLYQGVDSVEKCMKEIKAAFRWNKPAVISTHRINYVGGLDSRNRSENIKKLEYLLNYILKKWPQVEFLSSDKLGTLID